MKVGSVLVALLIAGSFSWSCRQDPTIRPTRSDAELAQRILALSIVGLKDIVGPRRTIDHEVELAQPDFFTEDEYLFVTSSEPVQTAKHYEYRWRSEAACMLLWAAGMVDSVAVEDPAELCDVHHLVPTPIDALVAKMKRRDPAQIGEMKTFYRGCELGTSADRIEGRDKVEAHPAIVFFRHQALIWLTSDRRWLE